MKDFIQHNLDKMILIIFFFAILVSMFVFMRGADHESVKWAQGVIDSIILAIGVTVGNLRKPTDV